MTNNQAIEALLRIRCIIHEDSLEEQALVYAIEALEGKDTDVPSNDTISRQQAIYIDGLDVQIRCEMCRNPMHTDRGCDGHCKYDEKLYERIMQILDERITPLPSAEPERKTGKWNMYYRMHSGDTFICNRCGSCFIVVQGADKMNFCPNCGSYNGGEQDESI